MSFVWKYFLDLNRKRGGGFGPSPISYTEILSYFTLHNIVFDEMEVTLIDVLDNIALEYYNKEQKKNSNSKKTK